jgi:hypothetical protein
MEHHLEFNICRLESSHLPNHDVPDLDARISEYIPDTLAFACCKFPRYLRDIPLSDPLAEILEHFFTNSFFWWLEVLSLLRWIDTSLAYLRSVWERSEVRDT